MYRHVHVCVAMYVWVHARMYAMACKGVCVSVIVSKRNEDEQERSLLILANVGADIILIHSILYWVLVGTSFIGAARHIQKGRKKYQSLVQPKNNNYLNRCQVTCLQNGKCF